ncbi:Cytochrome c oxidase polypeptide 5, mitochondrial [Salinomyces thailandicus]|uniref:Cytochrome c oxidase polypeptide V n=1 Tax=Salinomyces thailandicus TaxID=706561 RepID=A0A4U0TUV3_9PEZI|nr:Cytochrome c oxidase polypeptide 5, mitochondrial [Salinomyces thailandica]
MLSRSAALARALPRSIPTTARVAPTVSWQQQRNASHAISNPTLANIEKRWEVMPPQEQADLWMALRDRMKVDWNEMTMNEKKAAYWVAFGPHGPRALPPPGESWKVFRLTMYGIAASFALFLAIKAGGRGPPRTMTKEHQEATNEYMKERNIEPITGVSSEGYVGKGMVQTDRSSASLPEEEE